MSTRCDYLTVSYYEVKTVRISFINIWSFYILYLHIPPRTRRQVRWSWSRDSISPRSCARLPWCLGRGTRDRGCPRPSGGRRSNPRGSGRSGRRSSSLCKDKGKLHASAITFLLFVCPRQKIAKVE